MPEHDPEWTCATCVFAHLEKGECRRHPPVEMDMNIDEETLKGFGFVRILSSDWCGEHRFTKPSV